MNFRGQGRRVWEGSEGGQQVDLNLRMNRVGWDENMNNNGWLGGLNFQR